MDSNQEAESVQPNNLEKLDEKNSLYNSIDSTGSEAIQTDEVEETVTTQTETVSEENKELANISDQELSESEEPIEEQPSQEPEEEDFVEDEPTESAETEQPIVKENTPITLIERDFLRKPFLGGYRDRRNGIEYHHASSQTPLPQKPDQLTEVILSKHKTVKL